MGKYEDMIDRERPSSKRKKMLVADRAKIFMPFSALTGLDDLIAEKQKITTERVILSEERKMELDQLLEQCIREDVTVQFFVKDEKASQEQEKEVGTYERLQGTLQKVDFVSKTLTIEDVIVHLEDIIEMKPRSRYVKHF